MESLAWSWVVECNEDRIKEAEAWLEKVTDDGIGHVLDGAGSEGARVTNKVEGS